MEFIVTNYSYYLPFKNKDGKLEGITREHIRMKGDFLGLFEARSQSTRDLLRNINVGYENTTSDFHFYIATDAELKRLSENEESSEINTKISFKATKESLKISGHTYMSHASFEQIKSLISIIPNSNAYFRFETIVYDDKVINDLPLEIELYSSTCGMEMSFPIQQIKNSA